jgi:hypothetical protein
MLPSRSSLNNYHYPTNKKVQQLLEVPPYSQAITQFWPRVQGYYVNQARVDQSTQATSFSLGTQLLDRWVQDAEGSWG